MTQNTADVPNSVDSDSLSPDQAKILQTIESQIGHKLSPLKKIQWDSQGYLCRDGKIIAMGLFRCGLSDASVLETLPQLEDLNLGSNTIQDVSFLRSFTNLKTLNLWNNSIADASFLKDLTRLEELDLGSNKIQDVSFLRSLTNLKTLNLWNNSIADASSLKDLTRLEELNLSSNKIQDFSFLRSLTNLKTLDLWNNSIADASFLKDLTRLEELDLGRNKIHDFSFLRSLTNLKKLNLWNNSIADASFLKDLTRLEELDLSGNPLQIPPPEIAKQGIEAIRNYFQSLDKDKKQIPLYEAKLLIVGRGEVGKTWLTHRLVTGKLPQKDGTTRGIDIHTWQFDTNNIRNFRANFWDFGGQQILHSTHQFFLTKRSLYLFVWEARTDDDVVSFDYWLNIIKLLSNSSPVIVVMNKCDERIKNIDEQTYGKNFNILGFYKVSAKANIGIKELRSRIQEEMARLPHIGTPLPQAWMKIREKMEGLGKPYIAYREYLGICDEFGLDKTQADYLSGYYHNLGVILHFQDNPVLQETVFLQPEWVTEAVYQVVENFEVQKKNGRLLYKQLAEILNTQQYPVEIHHKLLELMKKFELCFELEGKDEYIVPELLKGDRPKFEWEDHKNLQFEYDYKFMPAGIITRFIARVHELHKDELYWKSGVVLDWEKHTQALVISETINRKIRIWIKGQDTKGLLAIIRHNIEHIHESLNRPDVQQLLPCICKQCQQSRNPYFHKYQELLIVQQKGKEARCNQSAEDIPIEKLFGEYGLSEDLENRLQKEYAKETEQHVPNINISPTITVNPVVTNSPNQSQTVTLPKESTEKKPGFWGRIWKVIAGIILLAGGLYSCIKILESETVENWRQSKSTVSRTAISHDQTQEANPVQPGPDSVLPDPNKTLTP